MCISKMFFSLPLQYRPILNNPAVDGVGDFKRYER